MCANDVYLIKFLYGNVKIIEIQTHNYVTDNMHL